MRKRKDIWKGFPNLGTSFRDNSQDLLPEIHDSGKTGEFFHRMGKKLDVWRKLKYNVACKDANRRLQLMVK